MSCGLWIPRTATEYHPPTPSKAPTPRTPAIQLAGTPQATWLEKLPETPRIRGGGRASWTLSAAGESGGLKVVGDSSLIIDAPH
jgi:hypothetical protein